MTTTNSNSIYSNATNIDVGQHFPASDNLKFGICNVCLVFLGGCPIISKWPVAACFDRCSSAVLHKEALGTLLTET